MPRSLEMDRSRDIVTGAIATGETDAIGAYIGNPGIGIDRVCAAACMVVQAAQELPDLAFRLAEARELRRVTGKSWSDPDADLDRSLAILLGLIDEVRRLTIAIQREAVDER